MNLPNPASMAVAYLGAGAFYAATDIVSEARSKQAVTGLAGALAAAALACVWAPAAAAVVARYAVALGWRPALAFFLAIVAPTIALFVGALLFAAELA